MLLWDKAFKMPKTIIVTFRQDSGRDGTEVTEIIGRYLIYSKIIVLLFFKVFKKTILILGIEVLFKKKLSMRSMYSFNKSPLVKHADGSLSYSCLTTDLFFPPEDYNFKLSLHPV